MKAYIICCNDSIEAVILKDKYRARVECQRLSDIDCERRRKQGYSDEDFSNIFFWHIHTIKVTK